MRGLRRLVAAASVVGLAACESSSEPTTLAEGGIPSAVRAAIAGTTVDLTWDPVAGAIGYRIYMAEVGGVKKVNVLQLPGNMTHGEAEAVFHHPAGLEAAKKYYFVVTSIQPGNKESRESCEVTAKMITSEVTSC
jgi:hypothetical protein